jgi:hypothetical protein
VVHINPLTEWKVKRIKEFFNGFHVEVYEIEAEEVLRKDSSTVPKYLKCKQISLKTATNNDYKHRVDSDCRKSQVLSKLSLGGQVRSSEMPYVSYSRP